MYGFLRKAVESYVVKEHSSDVWEEIINAWGNADVSSNEEAVGCSEKEINDLIKNASKILGIEHNQLMEKIGFGYFESSYMSNGYDNILKSMAPDFKTFITMLDSLHDHFSYRYSEMNAPSFRIPSNSKSKDVFQIYYYTERKGLEWLVIGIMKAAAKILFQKDISITIGHQSNLRQAVKEKHVVFDVNTNGSNCNTPLHYNRRSSQAISNDMACDLDSVIDPETFAVTFPFHLIIDRHLIVHQAGAALMRTFTNLKPGRTYFQDILTIVRPNIDLSFEQILSRVNSIFHVKSLEDKCTNTLNENEVDEVDNLDDTDDITSLRLKGQMMYLKESDTIIFFASPTILSLDGLSEKGMYLSDIPIHDATRDVILLSEQHTAENELKNKFEILTEKLQKTSRELESEQKLADRLLYSILPTSVADDLRAKRPVAAKKFEKVTILFSGIADFSSLCNCSSDPIEIVDTLNDIYIRFDQVCDNNNDIYKVETVGDKYMCVSGLPKESTQHAHNIALLALDFMDIINGKMVGGRLLTITVGIHSGEVVAGVIGQKLPRYCLFGNVVNLTSRTETTGLKGKINLTESTRQVLLEQPDPGFVFEYRGPVVMKGKKEPMKCYILSRKQED